MLKLAIVLIGLGFMSVHSGTTNCMFGQTYWCENAANAAKCGMTDYCMKNVWKNQPSNVAGDQKCSICYMIYNQLHQIYNAGGNTNILDMLLEIICSSNSDGCVNQISNVYEQIEKFVSAEDAESACQIFGMCSSGKMYIEVEQYNRLVNGFQCTGCQYIISEVKSAVSQISDEDLMKLMEQACQSMDSKDEDGCTTMATEYVDYVKTFIETLDAGELCTDFKMCNNDFESLEQFKAEMKEIMSDSIEGTVNGVTVKGDSNNINACSVCKIAISVAEMQLKVINLTLSTGNYVVKQLCSMFGNDYCYKLQEIIESVQSRLSTILDPTSVCETLNVCSSSQLKSQLLEPSFEVRQAQKIVKKFLDSFK